LVFIGVMFALAGSLMMRSLQLPAAGAGPHVGRRTGRYRAAREIVVLPGSLKQPVEDYCRSCAQRMLPWLTTRCWA
jgi:hypothetical protein